MFSYYACLSFPISIRLAIILEFLGNFNRLNKALPSMGLEINLVGGGGELVLTSVIILCWFEYRRFFIFVRILYLRL